MLELRVIEEIADQYIKLAMIGELDTHGQTQVSLQMTALTVPFRRDSIVDMSGVTYISSMGIGLLLNISSGLKRQGKRLIILAPQPPVLSVLQVARLQSHLYVIASEEQLQQVLTDGVPQVE
jgi:anti-sigma B factor antagonist